MNKEIFCEDQTPFSPTIASVIGIRKSVFIEQIKQWQQLKEINPEENKDSFYDGSYWINTNIQQLCDQFPFFSKRGCQNPNPTMRRLIKSLIEVDLIDFIESKDGKSFWIRVKKNSVENLIKNVSRKNFALKFPEQKKKFWEYK